MKKRIIIGILILSAVLILSVLFLTAYMSVKPIEEISQENIIGNSIASPDRIVYKDNENNYYEFVSGSEEYLELKELLNYSFSNYEKNGINISEEELEKIKQDTFLEFDYKKVSKNFVLSLNKEINPLIKLGNVGGNICIDKVKNIKKINNKLEELTKNKEPKNIEYKEYYSKNILDYFEYKYQQLFNTIDYSIYQVKIDNYEDYDKFKYICNLAIDEEITENTFKDNIVIITVSLIPKIEVEVNVGNIKYTYNSIENSTYGYRVHVLEVSKLVNTDCIYNNNMTDVENRIKMDKFNVEYDSSIENIDSEVFVTDFDNYINEYKNTNEFITKEEAKEIAEKGFQEAERICGTYEESTEKVSESEVLPNNFFTRKNTESDQTYYGKVSVYIFQREDEMGNGVSIYVDKATGKIIGGDAFGD